MERADGSECQERERQSDGEFEILLAKNGKRFSRTRSSRKKGASSAIKTERFMGLQDDPNAFIVNAHDDKAISNSTIFRGWVNFTVLFI